MPTKRRTLASARALRKPQRSIQAFAIFRRLKILAGLGIPGDVNDGIDAAAELRRTMRRFRTTCPASQRSVSIAVDWPICSCLPFLTTTRTRQFRLRKLSQHLPADKAGRPGQQDQGAAAAIWRPCPIFRKRRVAT